MYDFFFLIDIIDLASFVIGAGIAWLITRKPKGLVTYD